MVDGFKKQTNQARTENGAMAYGSTESFVLDLFSTIGALRARSDNDILLKFWLAWEEDKDLALKTLFYARDIRGGLGERRLFRVILKYLGDTEKDTVVKNLPFVSEYGRWDDLFVLFGTDSEDEMVRFVTDRFNKDLSILDSAGADEKVSLLGKWMPSINASRESTVHMAKMFCHKMGLTYKEYRQKLALLRAEIDIIENHLRERRYDFDYEKQTSNSLMFYRKAFDRNDFDRYEDYLDRVEAGTAVMHTGTLYPYQIVQAVFNDVEEERRSLDVTWKALPNYGSDANALVVCDTSGSMYYTVTKGMFPAFIAISLSIYFAERNTGPFANHFISFSEHPKLIKIIGKDIYEKVRYIESLSEVANTNIEAVFNLILDVAIAEHLTQADMPEMIYIISDMEFDSCATDPNLRFFYSMKQKYEENGFALPILVFWNVNSFNDQQPVTMNEKGVLLVSGASVSTFNMAVSRDLSPYNYMLKILNSERYAPISA